jgi:uncharacterized RDD family membrane protein YckC
MARALPTSVGVVSSTLRRGGVPKVTLTQQATLGSVEQTVEDARSDLGLPAAGSGSLAPSGRRAGAFLLDLILSILVASAFTAPHLPRNVSLAVFAVEYVFFSALIGQTPGMWICRIRLARIDRPRPVGLLRAVVRTILLILLIPALVMDRNGRGVHDRLTQTAVVRA